MLEVVFPSMCLVSLLSLIHFDMLAGSSGIGRPGWSVLVLFFVEPGLANGFLTLYTLVSFDWCVVGLDWMSLSCEKVSSPFLVLVCFVLEIAYLFELGGFVYVAS